MEHNLSITGKRFRALQSIIDTFESIVHRDKPAQL